MANHPISLRGHLPKNYWSTHSSEPSGSGQVSSVPFNVTQWKIAPFNAWILSVLGRSKRLPSELVLSSVLSVHRIFHTLPTSLENKWKQGGETCLHSRNLTLSEKKSCVCIETAGGTTWVRMRLLGKKPDQDYYGLTKCFEDYPGHWRRSGRSKRKGGGPDSLKIFRFLHQSEENIESISLTDSPFWHMWAITLHSRILLTLLENKEKLMST